MDFGTFQGLQRLFTVGGDEQQEGVEGSVGGYFDLISRLEPSASLIENINNIRDVALRRKSLNLFKINQSVLSEFEQFATDETPSAVKYTVLLSLLAAIYVEASVNKVDTVPDLAEAIRSYSNLKMAMEIGDLGAQTSAKLAKEAASKADDAVANLVKTQAAVNENLTELIKLRAGAERELARVVEGANEHAQKSDIQVNGMRSKIDELEPLVERLSQVVGDTKDKIDAFKASVRENLGQKDTHDLWNNRARSHGASFKYSLGALVFLIVGVPLIAAYNYEQVSKIVAHVNSNIGAATVDGTVTATLSILNRVMIFGVPIGLYIWLIKYLMRFNHHNLLLHEDAAQRATMMNTYYNLIEADAAKPEDRELILTALFRPTISQPSDNVELPLIEAIKAFRG